MKYDLHDLGDNAVIIIFGEDINLKIQQKVQAVSHFLDDSPPEWMVEYIPAFTSVSIFYDPIKIARLTQEILPYEYVCYQINLLLKGLTSIPSIEQRVVEIPVCYGGELGPDLESVAKINGLTTMEVVDIHSGGEYVVYMIGFSPGFPYIGGMSERISAPRRATPRVRIPERSVGIAGMQTGIYPIETPGGWQLIGRTPVRLFRPEAERPSLLKAGDRIRFKPISLEEYNDLVVDDG